MDRRSFTTLGAATALALFVADSAWAAGETVKIGFNAPLTGFAAADGNSAKIGAELAVDQANAAGGIDGREIELVVYDDQAKPDQAVPIANKLIGRDGVKIGISGSYSGATRAAATVYQNAGIPYISAYAVHPDITRAGDYVFRTSFVGEVQGRAGAKLIGETLGKKRVSLITLQNDFGKSLAAGFKAAAGDFGIE
ncbi:MAG: ABC transporter substrate-binding protein, partial [Rhodospirillales bacterium]|nr:ABC transporter substrate-binding protein [Rhodospirillales bacterium]